MSIRDPKNARSRSGKIILPNEARVDEMAARQVAQEQAVENNPFFKLLTNLRKEIYQDLARVSEQNRQLTIRLHALFDYLNSAGILLWHGMDQQTGKVLKEIPTHTEEGGVPLFEILQSHNILPALPAVGFDAYIEEHMAMSKLLIDLNMMHQRQGTPMKEILEMVRAFNNAPGRLRKITGEQIALIQYLTENPDHLPEEELDALASEFQLRKEEEPNGMGEVRTEGSTVSKEEASVPQAAVPVAGDHGVPEPDTN